jgi:hypothetical protein
MWSCIISKVEPDDYLPAIYADQITFSQTWLSYHFHKLTILFIADDTKKTNHFILVLFKMLKTEEKYYVLYQTHISTSFLKTNKTPEDLYSSCFQWTWVQKSPKSLNQSTIIQYQF